MRVNPNLQPDILSGIEQSEQAVATAMQQVTTGQRVNQASDDPTASAALVTNLAQSANVDQYKSNATSALSQLQTANSSLSAIVGLLTQAISLGTEGANSTASAGNRQSIATQIQGILSNVVSDANTTYQGVSLFGGTANGTAAFTADSTSPSGYAYNGNSGVNSTSVGDSLSVQTNVPGNTLFTQSGADVLGSLAQLATALQSGTSAAIGTAVNAISSALTHVSQQQGVYVSSISQLNSQDTYLSQETLTLASQQTSLIGVDAASAAETLARAETQNSAILAAAAKVLPTSLLQYLQN